MTLETTSELPLGPPWIYIVHHGTVSALTVKDYAALPEPPAGHICWSFDDAMAVRDAYLSDL